MRSPSLFSSAGPALPASRCPEPRRLVHLIAPLMVVASLGCQEGVQAPTDPGTASPPPPALATSTTTLAFEQVSPAGLHSCGVTLDHLAYCWGFGPNGQLGTGASEERRRPVAVSGGLRFRQVSAGNEFTCGVTTDDRGYCWGFNARGQLGDGTETTRFVPVAVAGNLRFRQVSAGSNHACAVTTDQRAYCWGLLTDDEPVVLGNGTTVGSATPVPVTGGLAFRQVSAGSSHTCGLTTSNEAFCWGADASGQIGDGGGASPLRLRPTRVAGAHRFKQLDAGGLHSCAVTPANRAYCWGDNSAGQLGDGTRSVRFSPRAVTGGIAFERVTAGRQSSCGETTDNRTYCWGSNASGQLGIGSQQGLSLTPVVVSGGHFFNQVSTGDFHTCAKTAAGKAYCWGNNGNGGVGDGSQVGVRYVPVPVAGAM
jgi:alpha-tubulin suppressor-like RCC1 family protein